jgi:predicted metal-binding protein
MNKRKDECLFCTSRKCHTRIVRQEKPSFDEIACDNHSKELYKFANLALGGKGSGVFRHHISSTGILKRGDDVSCIVN